MASLAWTEPWNTWLFEKFGQAALFCSAMAHLDGETSNELFEALTEWNTTLEHLKSQDFTVPPCP